MLRGCADLLAEGPPISAAACCSQYHVHLRVHRHRFGKALLGPPAIVTAAMQFAEAEVAVCDEGTHSDLTGERDGLPVVRRCHRLVGAWRWAATSPSIFKAYASLPR